MHSTQPSPSGGVSMSGGSPGFGGSRSGSAARAAGRAAGRAGTRTPSRCRRDGAPSASRRRVKAKVADVAAGRVRRALRRSTVTGAVRSGADERHGARRCRRRRRGTARARRCRSPVAAAVDVRARERLAGHSGFSPASMPKPALLCASLSRIVWPPSATAMPSLAVLVGACCPRSAAPPTGSPSASKSAPSSAMPAPPARCAMLSRIRMPTPSPISKPVWRLSEASLSSTSRWLVSRRLDAARVEAQVAVAHLGVVRVVEHDAAVGLLVRRDADDLVAVGVVDDHAGVAVAVVRRRPRRGCGASPCAIITPASPVSWTVLSTQHVVGRALEQHAAVAVELRVGRDAVHRVALDAVAVASCG